MRLFVTGGTGVLGRALRPLALAAGHDLTMPTRQELDLFDAAAVGERLQDADAILHLATRIPPLGRLAEPDAWGENDRLRAQASRILVDQALETRAAVYLQPTVTFVYPAEEPADEATPLAEVAPHLRSGLVAEEQAARFAAGGRRGVVLRFGLLDGPGTGHDQPVDRFGATLEVRDAARALLAALDVPSGIYNVCRDDERISNRRFKEATGWRPER